MGAHWLLSLQLLHGALRCLRHLWRPYTHPAPAQAPPPLLPAASHAYAAPHHAAHANTHTANAELPISYHKLLPLLAAQVCGTQPLLQHAALDLLRHGDHADGQDGPFRTHCMQKTPYNAKL